jgi:glycosyltransferase involved in cell wall biosynthesis
MRSDGHRLRVLAWGTYDLGKPRTRILLSSLARRADISLVEVHADVWRGVEDKGNVRGVWRKLHLLARWLAAYGPLAWRYLRAPAHDVVLVGYPGQLDVLVLWPLAKLRGVPIVWDAFLSLYDTIVADRRLIDARHPMARLLHGVETMSCRAAGRVVLDTAAHARYFADEFKICQSRLAHVFVGAESSAFAARPVVAQGPAAPLRVLFYGQFIPLHGIDTIIDAARLMQREDVDWLVIGQGQEAARIREKLDRQPLPRLLWVPWIPYEQLQAEIASADICLGVFGASAKAARVIPNKVFQILSVGRPLVTRDSPAIRELIPGDGPGIRLVPPGDPSALAAAIRTLSEQLPALSGRVLHGEITARFRTEAIGDALTGVLTDAADMHESLTQAPAKQ